MDHAFLEQGKTLSHQAPGQAADGRKAPLLTQRPAAQEAESKIRTLTTVWNVLDFMAFFPPLLETALLYGAKLSFSLGRFDLRWFKILRCPPPVQC